VGAALTGGHDLEQLVAAQSVPDPNELPAVASEEVLAAWYGAFTAGASDRLQVGMAMGRIGRAHPEPVPRAARRAVVRAGLVATDTGELHVFDACCGVPLVDAVAASGAVPGVWPLERFAGRFWIDGGMVSTANAHLTSGHDRVVVIAPLPDGYGAIPAQPRTSPA